MKPEEIHMKFSNQNRNRIIALLSMLAAGILIGQIFSTAERTVQAKVQKIKCIWTGEKFQLHPMTYANFHPNTWGRKYALLVS